MVGCPEKLLSLPSLKEAALVTIVEDWLMGQGFISLPGDEDRTITALEAAQVPKG